MYLPIYAKPLWWYRYPKVPNKDEIVRKILACRNTDGGFGNYPQNPSYLETLFYASVALSLLNETNNVGEDTIQHILNSHREDGGFGEQRSSQSNLFNTFYAVISLKVLDRIDSNVREKVIQYLRTKIVHDDGIYEKRLGFVNTTSLFWVNAITQSLVYRSNELHDKMVSFCMSCYNEEISLFSAVPNGLPTIQNTYECLVILKECSALNLVDSNRIYNSIIHRKKGSLFLDDLLGYYTFSTSMWAISSLKLIGHLSDFENADVYSFATDIFRSTNAPVYETFCAVCVMTNVYYVGGRIRTDRTQLSSETGETESFDNIKVLINKMQRSGLDYSEYDFSKALLHSKSSEIRITNSFLQILLHKDANRIYEIEVDENSGLVLSLIAPISRVTGECISTRTITSNRIRLLGVFDAEDNLHYSKREVEIMKKYCKNNNVYKYSSLVGEESTFSNLLEHLYESVHIFYYSGHCHNGHLHFSGQEVKIDDVLDALVENHCSIVILNCCNSYEYIRNYYEMRKYLNNSLNVICTLNDVSDEQAMVFMTSLFRYLELGYPISEAVRSTKYDLFIEYKGYGNTWWSYLLFGNPYTIIDNRSDY